MDISSVITVFGGIVLISYVVIRGFCISGDSDDEEFDVELGMRTKIRHERGI